MIVIGEIIVLCLLGFFFLNLLLLAVLALFVPLRTSIQTARFRKFVFVIPAHDEEVTIAKTVQSLLEVEYPRESFEVTVVADNCSDETAIVARREGATVMERHDTTHRGKGQALQWAFSNLLEYSSDYESYIVIDADSVVSKNFLKVLNWYREQGYGAIQVADLVSPNPEAWSSEVSRMSLAFYNYVRPLGRKAIKCTAGLRGNGMCFSAETLRTVPWRAFSLTEDYEYGLILFLRGIETVFAPEATVLATMPSKPRNAESQRTRWEGGRIAIIKKYVPVLLKTIVKKFSWKKFDILIELLTPAFVNMVGIVLLAIILKYVMAIFNFSGALELISLWWMLLLISILYVLTGLSVVGADAALLKAIIYFPRYLFWKIQLYLKFLTSGISKEWVRTTREEIKSDS